MANLLVLVLILIVLELAFRVVSYFVRGSASDFEWIVPDDKLGWVHNANAETFKGRNLCGENVLKFPSTHERLLKLPAHPEGRRILFLGDSFTQGPAASTGAMYYEFFEVETGSEYSVYAAGAGGYGNLQEYMLLKEIYEEVQPSIVVWQLTANDIPNNVYELDNSSIFSNQRPRPYLIDDEIEFRDAGLWFFDWSKGSHLVFKKLLRIDRNYDLGFFKWVDSFLALRPDEVDMYRQQGLNVLDYVLRKSIEEYPDTTFVGFSVDEIDDAEYQKVFVKNGLQYFSGFNRYVQQTDNVDCAPLDEHWNHLGNEVAGKRLSRLIETLD